MGIILFDREKHEYSDERGVWPSVTTILADAGIVDFSAVKQEIREKAMKRGSSVHWLLQLHDEGCLNYRKVPKAMRGYRQAWMTWRERSGFVPLLIEQPFISPHGYAGTPDRFGTFPNGTCAVVDIKSGMGDVADHVRFQLAPYARWYQLDLNKIPRRIGVQLHHDGTYRVREFPVSTMAYDFARFFGALNEWKGKHADD